MNDVAVLFARSDSVYKSLPGCDVYDKDRDAMNFQGGKSVVAHPPCRLWGQLANKATRAEPGEKKLAIWSVDQVRRYGGVLEHPASSRLWSEAKLPEPGQVDEYGGWTLPIMQKDWGHRAMKKTRLYIVGVNPREIPALPLRLGEATHVVSSGYAKGPHRHRSMKPEITKAEREHTPVALAEWLVELARRCAPNQQNKQIA